MSKSLQLSIPEPCHENWSGMTPSEKGRFCGSCQKHVVDFSKMTDHELQSFFIKKSNGNVCGRFTNDQLNRDIQIPKKKLPWVKYIVQVTIPAMLYSSKAIAQGQVQLKQDTIKVRTREMMMGKINPNVRVEKVCNLSTQPVFGTVVDNNGNPLARVNVSIKGNKGMTVTDANGNYSLKIEQKEFPIDLTFSSLGYQTITVRQDCESKYGADISRTVLENEVFVKQSDIRDMTGDELVGMLGGVFIEYKSPSKLHSIPLISNLVDTVTRLFKTYPNPVMSGSNINIEWKGIEEGYFQLNLADVNGRIVHQREIWIDKDARLLNFNIPTVPAGQYLLTMANKKTGKIHTEKLVIQ